MATTSYLLVMTYLSAGLSHSWGYTNYVELNINACMHESSGVLRGQKRESDSDNTLGLVL